MAYTPEEYEQLKAFHKEELRKRKALQEQLRRTYLRQKAEWHLAQMRASLEHLGLATEAEPERSSPQALDLPPPSSSDLPPKTLL